MAFHQIFYFFKVQEEERNSFVEKRNNFFSKYLMPLLTIFQLYLGGQFYKWKKPEYPVKTTDKSLTNFII